MYYLKAKNRYFLKGNVILYIENEYNEALNEIITAHYSEFCQILEEKGMQFAYLPKIRQIDENLFNELKDFINHHYPLFTNLNGKQWELITDELFYVYSSYQKLFYQPIQDLLQLPFYPKAGFIQNQYNGEDDETLNDFISTDFTKDYFQNIPLNSAQNIAHAIYIFLNNALNSKALNIRKFPQYSNDEDTLDIVHLDTENRRIERELKKRINALSNMGKDHILFDALITIMGKLNINDPILMQQVQNRASINLPTTNLSRLKFDYNFNLELIDYSKTINMDPITKTLYLLFM